MSCISNLWSDFQEVEGRFCRAFCRKLWSTLEILHTRASGL